MGRASTNGTRGTEGDIPPQDPRPGREGLVQIPGRVDAALRAEGRSMHSRRRARAGPAGRTDAARCRDGAMFEPTAVMVAGRGKLIALATPDELGLSIRVDDEHRPDWWCLLRLTRQQLADLLGQVNL